MSDVGLFALVDKVVAAHLTQETAVDRLHDLWSSRPQSNIDTDPELKVLDAAYKAASRVYRSLCLALDVTPVTTLEGALAKGRFLESDLQPASVKLDIFDRR